MELRAGKDLHNSRKGIGIGLINTENKFICTVFGKECLNGSGVAVGGWNKSRCLPHYNSLYFSIARRLVFIT